MKRLPLLLVLVLAITSSLVFIACGSDDSSDDSSSDSSAPTKKAYIAAADTICTQGDAAINKAGNEQFGNKMPAKEELGTFATEVVVPNVKQQLAALRSIPTPEGDEDELNALWDSLDEGITKLEEDPTSDEDPLADANEKARAYGFKSCGTDGT